MPAFALWHSRINREAGLLFIKKFFYVILSFQKQAMKISYKWLKEYIDVPPDRIGTILTNTGLEVSAVEHKGMHPETKQQLIVGKVIRKWQHPNADRLSLTEVDTGKVVKLNN